MARAAGTIEGSIGRYRLVKRLAVGGMADLFLAQQLGPRGYERTVVVKTIRSDLVDEEELIQMLLEEARIASCLRHENIVELYEVGEEAGTQFLAMEFLFGQDLSAIRDRCAELGMAIPNEHVITIMSDVLSALHYAHHEATFNGQPLAVIHRDVSPQNVIVGFDGTVKLLDFGLAKAAAQISRTRAGVLKGKYAYMSPEQVNFKVVDHRADIFSAGVLLWELLTQRRLFYRSSDYETVKAVMACEVPFPQSIRRDLPFGLSWVAFRALRRNPRWRYSSAGQMKDALLGCSRVSHENAREELAEWISTLFAPKLVTRDLALSRARTQNPGKLREVQDAGFELIDEVTDPDLKFKSLRPVTRAPRTDMEAGGVPKRPQEGARLGGGAGFFASVLGTWKWFGLVGAALAFFGVAVGIYVGSRTSDRGPYGYLTIRAAEEGVQVKVGSRMVGLAPVLRIPVAPGRHRITGFLGGRSRTTEVEVNPGQERIVELDVETGAP